MGKRPSSVRRPLVVSDKKILKISANENTLWTLAAMLDFKSAPKTQIW
jgi:arsenate reductase-like glutaredoxin family protein